MSDCYCSACWCRIVNNLTIGEVLRLSIRHFFVGKDIDMTLSTLRNCLREVATGIGSVLEIAPRRDYIYPGTTGFSKDRAKLHGDARKVRKDFAKAAARHG